MRSEANSLDLNNLPEDYHTRDGHESSPNTSSAGGRKNKSGGGKDERDEAGKIYECRFCSLKFCKSQALGGHMNRHRQERETETLNKARQLVFSNDLAPPHLGYVSSGHGQPISPGVYNQASNNGDESSLPFRSIYTSRMFPASPLIPPPPPPPPHLRPVPSQYGAAAPPATDYYVGHVVPNSHYGGGPNGSYYTCIGAPVGHGLVNSGGSGRGGGGDGQEEGLNWGRR